MGVTDRTFTAIVIPASHDDIRKIKASVLLIRPRGGRVGVTCRHLFSRSCYG